MWFLYVSIVVFNITAVFVKKNLRPNEFYVSILWGLLVSSFSDRFTDKYNIYGLFDLYFIEAKSLLIYLGIYPAVTVLIINWYPFNRPLINKIFYILCWSAFSTIYEWLSLKMGFLYHTNWNIWFSAISYPFLYPLLLVNLKFIRWLDKR